MPEASSAKFSFAKRLASLTLITSTLPNVTVTGLLIPRCFALTTHTSLVMSCLLYKPLTWLSGLNIEKYL